MSTQKNVSSDYNHYYHIHWDSDWRCNQTAVVNWLRPYFENRGHQQSLLQSWCVVEDQGECIILHICDTCNICHSCGRQGQTMYESSELILNSFSKQHLVHLKSNSYTPVSSNQIPTLVSVTQSSTRRNSGKSHCLKTLITTHHSQTTVQMGSNRVFWRVRKGIRHDICRLQCVDLNWF